MGEIVESSTANFSFEVPYKLIETGRKEPGKPLIVYLHGYNQNIDYFQKKTRTMLSLSAYHLFIQGPYPIYDSSRQKEFSKWGRAWYLYDGSQSLFLESLEKGSAFLENIIQKIKAETDASRVCVFGYSMGGYLGGYFTFSRWQLVDELIVAGGRIKTEAFEGKRQLAQKTNILAIHGKNDTSVYPEPQQKCIELLQSEGFNAQFLLIDEEHKLTDTYVQESKKWLTNLGYVES